MLNHKVFSCFAAMKALALPLAVKVKLLNFILVHHKLTEVFCKKQSDEQNDDHQYIPDDPLPTMFQFHCEEK